MHNQAIQSHALQVTRNVNKRQTKRYTAADDKKIVKYLLENERYKEINNNNMWKEMASQNTVPDHVWRSLKDRYVKTIIKKLNEYLPCDVASQMQEAYLQKWSTATQAHNSP